MEFETLDLSQDARGCVHLTLDRAEKHNALNALMIDELTQAARQLAIDPFVRVVVLQANGRSFCAGGDLGWMQDQMRADGPTRAAGAKALADMLQALDTLPKPLIGRIDGAAFGGGVGMASVCDVAIGTERVKMGLTEVRLGLIPATIAHYVIARMGAAFARRVFFSGRIFDAGEALRLGLLSRVVASDALDAAIEAEIAPYLAAAPGAVADAKALIRELSNRDAADAAADSIAALVARWETEEARAGIEAFFAKTTPPWSSDDST